MLIFDATIYKKFFMHIIKFIPFFRYHIPCIAYFYLRTISLNKNAVTNFFHMNDDQI